MDTPYSEGAGATLCPFFLQTINANEIG